VPKPKNTKLSVFKGREAKLNHAIFQSLALKGAQTIYDIHKQVRSIKRLRFTRYASVNKRVRVLVEAGYVVRVGMKNTKAGFEAAMYELAARAYLVTLLSSTSLEDLIMQLDEAMTTTILASII
jgi:hypothetical protein